MNDKKAIFLDRDGVICKDTHYVTSTKKLHIYEFTQKAVKLIKSKDYLIIVVSNQSGIARGMVTKEEVDKINDVILSRTNINKIYYCPHLPPVAEEAPPYRIHCKCRKPDIGMIEEAVRDFHIDLGASYLVGDRASDLQAARKAGLKAVLVMTGKGAETKSKISDYDFLYNDILEFAMSLKN